jgi:hypothetical protein
MRHFTDMQIEGAATLDEEAHFVFAMGGLGDEFLSQHRPVWMARANVDDIAVGATALTLQPIDLRGIGGENFVRLRFGVRGWETVQRSMRAPISVNFSEMTPKSSVSRKISAGLSAE